MNNVKIIPLSEIVTTVIDYRGKTPKKLGSAWTDKGYRALSAKNVKTRQIVNEQSIRYVDENLYRKWMKEEIQRGDILITSEAPFGQIFYWDSEEKIVLSQRLFAIRCKNEFYPKYIFQYMTGEKFQKELLSRATGTTVTGLRQSELLKCKLEIPKYDQQIKIASILCAFDDKIETNNQIIDNLENQIQLIAREYLSEKTPISEEVNLKDVCDFHTGYAYKGTEIKDEESKFGLITIKNFNRGGGFSIEACKPIIPSKKVKDVQFLDIFDIVVAHTDLTQKAEILGNAEIVLAGADFQQLIASMDLVKVVPHDNCRFSKFLIAAALKSRTFKTHCLQYANGTTVLHLNKKALSSYIFYVPRDDNLLFDISNLIESNMQQISVLTKQNATLVKLRDTLLPKLMSGKIIVNN